LRTQHTQHINQLSATLLIVLSLTALFLVLAALAQPPRPLPSDEGTEAHIFQLSIAALLPMTLVFLVTANWARPWRSALPLAFSAVATVLAFAALYYLEHTHHL
jgi:drug/metabolite transporter (DMT)-like permease